MSCPFQPSSNALRLWYLSRRYHQPSSTLREHWNVRHIYSRCQESSILTLHSLEYTSPESLRSPDTGILHQVDSKADLWSLGMILHKLLFFRLPYQWASTNDRPQDTSRNEENPMDKLEREVLGYMGCVGTIMFFSSALTVVGVQQIQEQSRIRNSVSLEATSSRISHPS